MHSEMRHHFYNYQKVSNRLAALLFYLVDSMFRTVAADVFNVSIEMAYHGALSMSQYLHVILSFGWQNAPRLYIRI